MTSRAPTDFPLDLLQAINDWQRGGDEAMKRSRGAKLKLLAASLDEKFRTAEGSCFRRVALDKFNTFEMGEKLRLSETISAWTSSLGVAKTFKGGVPPSGWQGVIFESVPSPGNVVLNLAALYGDPAFLTACDWLKGGISGYESGIARYENSQKEIILELDEVGIGALHSLGGFSSDLTTIARKLLGAEPTPKDLNTLRVLIEAGGLSLGADWIEGTAKDGVVEFWMANAMRLRPYRVPSR